MPDNQFMVKFKLQYVSLVICMLDHLPTWDLPKICHQWLFGHKCSGWEPTVHGGPPTIRHNLEFLCSIVRPLESTTNMPSMAFWTGVLGGSKLCMTNIQTLRHSFDVSKAW